MLETLEDHFSEHWLDNRYDTNNVEYVFDHYLRTGKGIGGDRDKAVLISAFLKSWGIATNFIRWTRYPKRNPSVSYDHVHNVCFDRGRNVWTGSAKELQGDRSKDNDYVFVFGVFRPPVIQQGYLSWNEWGPRDLAVNAWRKLDFTPSKVYDEFSKGFPTSLMKRLIIHSEDPVNSMGAPLATVKPAETIAHEETLSTLGSSVDELIHDLTVFSLGGIVGGASWDSIKRLIGVLHEKTGDRRLRILRRTMDLVDTLGAQELDLLDKYIEMRIESQRKNKN